MTVRRRGSGPSLVPSRSPVLPRCLPEGIRFRGHRGVGKIERRWLSSASSTDASEDESDGPFVVFRLAARRDRAFRPIPVRRRDNWAECRLGAKFSVFTQAHEAEADGHVRRISGSHSYQCRSNCRVARRKQRKVTVTFRSDQPGSCLAPRATVDCGTPMLSAEIEPCKDAFREGCDHRGNVGARLKLRAVVVEDEPADVELALQALRLADLEVDEDIAQTVEEFT